MPIALMIIGLTLVVTGIQNTYVALGTQIKSDFTGPGNFIFWIASIGAVGALGYVAALRVFSHIFMALIIIAMLIAAQKNGQGGFFGQLSVAINSGPK